MKALTLWQPWSSLVAVGAKTIETRSWSTSYRGPLAIHAAARRPDVGYFGAGLFVGHSLLRYSDRKDESYTVGNDAHGYTPTPLGAVVATCTLVDVVPIHQQWCQCGPRPGIFISRGVGGLGREVLGIYRPDGLAISRGNGTQEEHPWVAAHGWAFDEELIDQILYGDYRCGRFAWLLDDIKALPDPVPAKGGQRIWNWDGS